MTSIIGRLADQASVIKSSFSELEKAVIKATRHNLKPPKEKHVRTLITYTRQQPQRITEIISLLSKRLDLPDWIVVSKTLEVFHFILKDGSPSFANELKNSHTVFNLRNFKDISSPEATQQSLFVRKYSQYLEEKCIVYKNVGFEWEKDPSVLKKLSVDEILEKIPRLQSQMNALLNSRSCKGHINNSIVVKGFQLLLFDSKILYRALNYAVICLLEQYFTLGKPAAIKALDVYKLFVKETDALTQFFEMVRRFTRVEPPQLQQAPSSLLEALENYINEMDDTTPNTQKRNQQRDQVMSSAQKHQQAQSKLFDKVWEEGVRGPSKKKSSAATAQPHSNNNNNSSSDEDDEDDEDNDNDNDDAIIAEEHALSQKAAAHKRTQQNTQQDPFDNNGGKSTTQLVSFDDFDVFSSNSKPQQTVSSNNNNLFDPFGPTTTTTATSINSTFDPFGPTTSFNNNNNTNNNNYDEKKKNIEMLFQTTPPVNSNVQQNPFGFFDSSFGVNTNTTTTTPNPFALPQTQPSFVPQTTATPFPYSNTNPSPNANPNPFAPTNPFALTTQVNNNPQNPFL